MGRRRGPRADADAAHEGALRPARGLQPRDLRGRHMSTRAWDDIRPPQESLIDDCVHCGFCLPTCPTYTLWNEEMDSPRGRIVLMRSGLEEGSELSAPLVGHLDNCLGCMACVTACPSGVQYDKLIEDARAQVERNWKRPRRERLLRTALFLVFPHPGRLRALVPGMWLQGKLPLDASSVRAGRAPARSRLDGARAEGEAVRHVGPAARAHARPRRVARPRRLPPGLRAEGALLRGQPGDCRGAAAEGSTSTRRGARAAAARSSSTRARTARHARARRRRSPPSSTTRRCS